MPGRVLRDGRVNFLLPSLLALVFLLRLNTAFESPAWDMAPYLMRAADPAFAPGDFFTDASSAPNPRIVFGSAIAFIAQASGAGWYPVMFVLKVILVVATPVLFYFALLAIVRRHLVDARGAELLIAAGIVVLSDWRVNYHLSVAVWLPWMVQAAPQSVSQALALAGLILFLRDGSMRWPAILLFAAATFVHPAMSAFVMAMGFLMAAPRYRLRAAAAAVGMGWLLPAAILAWVFRPAAPLSAEEFIAIYVTLAHPEHYDVARFGTLSAYSWEVTFGFMLAMLALPGLIGAIRRMRDLALLSGLAVAAYAGSVLLQYVGTAIVPSKAIVSLGPSRFTMFGYWMAIVLWTILVCRLPLSGAIARGIAARVPGLNKPLFGIVLAALMVIGALRMDAPLQRIERDHAAFYAFVKSTPADSVFAAPRGMETPVAVVGQRPVFSHAFPFREDDLREYRLRHELLNGTPETQARHGSRERVYRSLTPADFARAAGLRRLDYVVVETPHAAAFEGIEPAYADERYRVYAMR